MPQVSRVLLNTESHCSKVEEFAQRLRKNIIGQDEAVTQLVSVYQTFLAGMTAPRRPIANLLLLGPTGSGKTRLVEAAAEILYSSPYSLIKIDCAEFQHSHEIAKLIGSPPGYIGHRETSPALTQEMLDQFHRDDLKLTLVLFDEIEKASDALWQLMLGILDKATLTLGDNRKVDFSQTIVFMTSNLGANEMSRLVSGGIGFVSGVRTDDLAHLTGKMEAVAVEAARRKFSPEFLNRIDKTVVFKSLGEKELRQILDLELVEVRGRLLSSQPGRVFVLRYTEEAKQFLLREGTDLKYGARHLKRAIERHLVFPLSGLIATGQVVGGDSLEVAFDESHGRLIFYKAAAPYQSSLARGGQ